MSKPTSGQPRKRVRLPKPKPGDPPRPRGRPPKPPKPDEEEDPDDRFEKLITQVRRRRASIELDDETRDIIGLCAMNAASQAELASVLGITLSALTYFFQTHPEAREMWDDGHNISRVRLRSRQFGLTKKQQVMAIFLGKQMLGQKDIVHSDVTINKPVNELTEEQLLDIIARAEKAPRPTP